VTAGTFQPVSVKKLLKHQRVPGLFGGRYRFSPYMACGHRCLYCDGRHEKYFVEGNFDTDIVARMNSPELLETELSSLREPGPVCISSGISDPYQPLEKELGLTRSCAEILSRQQHPVIIHTKSALALRDIDIWQRVNERSAVTLMVSLTMADDKIRECLESGASSVGERLALIKEFRLRGMNAGVLAMPFIPFLTDSRQNMEALLTLLAGAGVQFALPGLLTLKEGRQKEFFLKGLEKCFPDIVAPVADLYRAADRWGSPPRRFAADFHRTVHDLWSGFEMDGLVPHSVCKGQFTLYDHITVLLSDMISLYRSRGIAVERLREASDRYSVWVSDKRKFCSRRKSLRYSVIDDYLRAMIHSGELAELLKNEKLASFLEEIEKGAVFNYRTLELEKGE